MLSEAREVLGSGDLLVVYRWMPDQFLAALLLAWWVGGSRRVGFVAFDEAAPSSGFVRGVAVESRGYDAVVLVGPGWQRPEVDLLAVQVLAPLLVVDNHYSYMRPRRPNVLYFNPSPRGDSRGSWPSVTFTLSLLLGDATNLLVAASIVALLGRASTSVRAFQNAMARNGLNHVSDYFIPEACAMRALGVTAMGDPRAHASIPHSVVEASPDDPCRGLLDDALLASLQGMFEAVVEEYMPPPPRVRVRGEARHPLLSYLAREASFHNKGLGLAVAGRRFCAWNPTGRPLARGVGRLRRRGFRAFSSYQGLVNYLCGVAPRREGWEEILEEVLTGEDQP
ncbi:MAG: hypothetical protein F7C35_02060 [Desulfurococcales archaeon]|nr:hypothetical protein [Desulfurococcales archaeon]